MKPQLVVIGAPGPGHGKSTLARSLAGHGGYQVRPFARPLKAMAEGLLREMGWSWQQIDLYMNERKEEVVPELGVSLRTFLQKLGTEFGRNQIDSELWVRLWRINAEKVLADHCPVANDDCRFPNELQVSRDMGALLVYVERTDIELCSHSHSSDGQLQPHLFDLQLVGASLEELKDWGRRIAEGQVQAEGILTA